MTTESAYKELKANCIISPYGTDKDGYAKIKVDGTNCRHHRVVYAAFHGVTLADLAGSIIMHRCDTPACVNPEHLLVGTCQDNTSDMFAKGRQNKAQGAAHGLAKLTKEQALAIKQSFGKTDKQVAALYGVSKQTVSRIKTGKNWRTL